MFACAYCGVAKVTALYYCAPLAQYNDEKMTRKAYHRIDIKPEVQCRENRGRCVLRQDSRQLNRSCWLQLALAAELQDNQPSCTWILRQERLTNSEVVQNELKIFAKWKLATDKDKF